MNTRFYVLLLFIMLFVPTAYAQKVRSKLVPHTQAYRPRPERGSHIDIKVTPPGARGSDGRVLVEVYNRGKQHLALIQFDVTLLNRGGFEITAPVRADDLKPNMSGSQWIIIPRIRGAFPSIDEAIADNIKAVATDAREVKIKSFVDLIKN